MRGGSGLLRTVAENVRRLQTGEEETLATS
jgi:hypothetical protein